ncbi:DUF3310 domain-containing protein [Cytobacillus sp. FSL W8-0315]|uniref:DUF3310 domain-containing protein n=1 Tax=Cytobacillus sp. FSL W8-0315 TaxID=2921600 RepID=UPI0030FC2391
MDELERGAYDFMNDLHKNCEPLPNINYENMPEDIINKPNHYHKNEIDVNGYLEKHFPKESNVTVVEGFYIGNIIKYVSRHKEKNGMQDLEKAMFNLNKLMEWREKNG